MKKYFSVLLFLLFLTGCSGVNYNYEIKYKDVDMSGYEGVNSTNHRFKKTNIKELEKVIENKSSAIFYLGRTECSCCQLCTKHINNVAMDLDVDVYYLDVYDEDYPIVSDTYYELEDILYEILDVDEEGEKELQTPTVFTIINGKISDHLICTANMEYDSFNPSDIQIFTLENRYKTMFKPFCDLSQD